MDVAGESAAVDAMEMLWVALLLPSSGSRPDSLLAGVARVGAAREKAVDIARSPS